MVALTLLQENKRVEKLASNEKEEKKQLNPHFKDLDLSHGQKYGVISTKRAICQDLPLQIGEQEF
jgi:hypothetical protein